MICPSPIRVVTADPQPIFRAGVRQILAAFPDIAVVGEASSSVDAFTLCERVRPDLLLIDCAMPGAFTLVARMRERRSEVRAVILTCCTEPAVVSRALQLGVAGYLLKLVEPFDLAQALRSAAGGLLTLAPEVAPLAAAELSPPEPGPDRLSPREQAVLDLLLLGLSNQAMAAQLHLSCATIKYHLRNIYDKLGVHTRAEALALFYSQRQDGPEPAIARPRGGFARPALAVVR